MASSSAGSVQTESIEYIQPIERSPSAVSAAGTAAVAPPKFQSELSVFGEGASAALANAWSIIASGRSVRKWLFQ